MSDLHFLIKASGLFSGIKGLKSYIQLFISSQQQTEILNLKNCSWFHWCKMKDFNWYFQSFHLSVLPYHFTPNFTTSTIQKSAP